MEGGRKCTRALQGSIRLREEIGKEEIDRALRIGHELATDVNMIGEHTELHINSDAVVRIFSIMLHPSESAFQSPVALAAVEDIHPLNPFNHNIHLIK